MMTYMIATLICLGFLLANAADQHHIYARVRWAREGLIAKGFQKATEGMLVSRLGAALYFLTTALFIERHGTLNSYALSLSVALGLLVLFNLVILRKIDALPCSNSCPSRWEPVAAFVATIFSVGGLTLPFCFAQLLPSYRLTLANTGFVLNAVFSLLTVLVIDRRLSRLIDSSARSLCAEARAIVCGKTFAIACCALVYFYLGLVFVDE